MCAHLPVGVIQGMGQEQGHRSNGDRPVGKGVIAWTWLQGWEQEQGHSEVGASAGGDWVMVPVQGRDW